MSVELAFETVGQGPPVIILHGLFGSGRNWTQFAHALADTHHSVYLPDARNHGASQWAERMSYSDMAGDVLALIEREQLHRPVLIGHSMGGKTAMALALEHPRAVGGVAVIDIAPESYVDQFSPYVSAMRHLDVAVGVGHRQIRQTLAQGIGATTTTATTTDLLLHNLRQHDARFDWRVNLMAVAMCMRDLCAFPDPLARQRYTGPSLFVAGADSDYVRPASHAGIQRLFPRAHLSHIADAGHWVHADQPDALLHALHRWLPEAGAPFTASLCTAVPPRAVATR